MSVKITTNQNTVTVADADKSITIINNREPNRIDIVQPESDVIYVAALGPQGPAGTGGGGSSDLTALNSFSASILTFTGSIQTQVNNLTAATSSYIQASVTSSMIVSGALTASYYQEIDPVFVAISGTFATTSSLNSFTSSINTWTGSYNTGSFTGSFTGNLLGTSSWATNAQTASSVIVTLSSNTDERLPLVVAYTGSTSGTKLMYIDSGLDYNTSTNALYLPSNGAYIIGNTSLQSSVATFGSAGNQNHIVRITGSLNVSKSVNVDGAITAGFGTGTTGFIGTASWAQSSSQASTASYFVETDPIFVAKSASLATTGSNTFIGSQVITGSITVTNNLTVLGSQSVQYITSSQLDISTNLITVNTSTPAVRFGGIAVRDSGSLATGLTGSLLWDSQNNVWIYSNPSGAAYDGGIVLMGPRNTGGLGNEVGINSWYAALGDGSHHMTSSQIYNSGSLIRLETNTQVTGSLSVSAGITGSLFGNATTAAIANTLSSFANVDKINTGDPSDAFIRPSELEQSKYATLNIYNYNNFT